MYTTPLCAKRRGLQSINTATLLHPSLLILWPEHCSSHSYFSSLQRKTATMAINKAKVAIGFIVAGTLTVVFGAVLLFVGPAVMNDQVIKVSNGIIWILSYILSCFISVFFINKGGFIQNMFFILCPKQVILHWTTLHFTEDSYLHVFSSKILHLKKKQIHKLYCVYIIQIGFQGKWQSIPLSFSQYLHVYQSNYQS